MCGTRGHPVDCLSVKYLRCRGTMRMQRWNTSLAMRFHCSKVTAYCINSLWRSLYLFWCLVGLLLDPVG